jgi:uncharacterized protein involved in response to NO
MPALFSAPFRPFFLLAALLAVIDVPLWMLIRAGDVAHEGHLAGGLWHGHEMIFGFAVAVFAGFLLTAAQNWTGLTTARGPGLALLAGLWLAGRILLLLPDERLLWPAIVVDVLFLPAMAIALLRPLLIARNRRNLLFPVGMLGLAGLNLATHCAALGELDVDPSRVLWIALDLMAVMMVLMGGRVIPFFTRNALPEAGIGGWKAADVAAVAAAAAIVPVDMLAIDMPAGDGTLLGTVALVAGAASLVRMVPWRGWAARRSPILWILHLAYLWLSLALLLRGAAAFGLLPMDAALHALGAGAIGSMTLGMMSRVALGHSGRPLTAAPLTVLAYCLILAAAVMRVAAAFDGDALLNLAVALWVLGWSCFLVTYVPVFVTGSPPRQEC